MSGRLPKLILFAKKPVTGTVKTRLCPPLSEIQARELATFLLEKSIENFSEYWPGEIELSAWPDSRGRVFESLASRYDVSLSSQARGDLGEKMQVAMIRAVQEGHSAMVMGADVPHCSGEIIDTAYRILACGKNIIGPSVDGGYYCIGVSNPKPAMFDGVQWGSPLAYQQTLSSCIDAGITFDTILPELNDLDTFEDLLLLSGQLPELRNFIDEKKHSASQP